MKCSGFRNCLILCNITDLLNFDRALVRKMCNTFTNRLTLSDNAIIKVLVSNMVAREKECGIVRTAYCTDIPHVVISVNCLFYPLIVYC